MKILKKRGYKCGYISIIAKSIELKFCTDIYPSISHLPENFRPKALNCLVSVSPQVFQKHRFLASLVSYNF